MNKPTEEDYKEELIRVENRSLKWTSLFVIFWLGIFLLPFRTGTKLNEIASKNLYLFIQEFIKGGDVTTNIFFPILLLFILGVPIILATNSMPNRLLDNCSSIKEAYMSKYAVLKQGIAYGLLVSVVLFMFNIYYVFLIDNPLVERLVDVFSKSLVELGILGLFVIIPVYYSVTFYKYLKENRLQRRLLKRLKKFHVLEKDFWIDVLDKLWKIITFTILLLLDILTTIAYLFYIFGEFSFGNMFILIDSFPFLRKDIVAVIILFMIPINLIRLFFQKKLMRYSGDRRLFSS